MLVHSDNEPEEIVIDRIETGVARLLVHWNITQVTIPDPMADGIRQEWQYNECVIPWVLPQKFEDFDAVRAYIAGIRSEILNWAEATELTV